MTDWGDWPEELKDFWENTSGYHEGYLSHSEMQDFIGSAEDLFWQGWGHDSEGGAEDSDARKAARDEFFELMAEYDLDAALFDWNDWRDWYETA